MKKLFRPALMLYAACILPILITGCHGGDEQKNIEQEAQIIKISEREINKPIAPKIISIEIVEEPPVEELEPAVEIAPAALIPPIAGIGSDIIPPIAGVEYPGVITPLTAPMAFARSVFDDNSDIDPWLANYIGSYGILPGRFGRIPFLYSFEVNTDGDSFLGADPFDRNDDD